MENLFDTKEYKALEKLVKKEDRTVIVFTSLETCKDSYEEDLIENSFGLTVMNAGKSSRVALVQQMVSQLNELGMNTLQIIGELSKLGIKQ